MADEKETKKKRVRDSAEKRLRQSEKNRVSNKAFKSEIKTVLNSYREAIVKGDKAAQETTLSLLFSMLDKAAKQGIYKQNKTDRLKSRAVAKKK